MKTIAEAINFIHSRPKGGRKESLDRMYALLKSLGNPQDQLPPAIHVTGTNGKGSVATMTSNILRVAGYKTGLFISPYIIDFRERIQINNELISEAHLVATTKKIAKTLKKVDTELAPDIPTEFEVLTAVMFTYFAEQKLDALVVEVGIGGQLDSTNVMPNARVAVITSIGLDHQALLGKTIEEIAWQKAGIIHNNMSVVIGNLPENAYRVIADRAKVSLIQGSLNVFEQGLPGKYQIQNTATAVAVVEVFDRNIKVIDIQQGLRESHFAARFELIKPDVMIDGAHNAQGLKELYQALNTPLYQTMTMTLIIGSLIDKNVVSAFDDILKNKRFQIVLVPFAGPNGRHSLDIETVAQKYGVEVADNWHEAYHQHHTDMIIFTGSLYFVSEVRGEICQN
ncbi:bifunctional folylpolyglutamate synthase/dihydrofolate synthase [Leuconostoc gelidum subsp. aenigmaticum]|uniref:bifunctional folylpolyglutamate synthase/dihydrofolate synthase n=1 Tax=Leuconostoc gelidum TaxID=1244 RepID=UPI001CC81433|nr:folylpolyglutamate synthase/dihydrofolate synthase family protein [Leuconostoc gelidum]MBZ6007835.1 bifunctional folylpolyglutamate synthase/dihydrofolate synthase [Leuconostoc gelidum subsp. aenigmaticum]